MANKKNHEKRKRKRQQARKRGASSSGRTPVAVPTAYGRSPGGDQLDLLEAEDERRRSLAEAASLLAELASTASTTPGPGGVTELDALFPPWSGRTTAVLD